MTATETNWSPSPSPAATAQLTREDADIAWGEVTFPIRGTFAIRFERLTPDKHGVKRAELLIGGTKSSLSWCCDNDGRNWAWHGTPWVEGYHYRVAIDGQGLVKFWDRPAPVYFGADGVRIP